jgi:hypothetical protein
MSPAFSWQVTSIEAVATKAYNSGMTMQQGHRKRDSTEHHAVRVVTCQSVSAVSAAFRVAISGMSTCTAAASVRSSLLAETHLVTPDAFGARVTAAVWSSQQGRRHGLHHGDLTACAH